MNNRPEVRPLAVCIVARQDIPLMSIVYLIDILGKRNNLTACTDIRQNNNSTEILLHSGIDCFWVVGVGTSFICLAVDIMTRL